MSGRRYPPAPKLCDPYYILDAACWLDELQKSRFNPRRKHGGATSDSAASDGGALSLPCAAIPAPTPADLTGAFEANEVHRGLDAFFVAGQHHGWAKALRRLGDVCRAARGEEALWAALAAIPRGPFGRTSLMAAAFRGDADRVLFLLRCGASVTATDKKKSFPLPRYSSLRERQSFGTSNRTALHWGAESGSAACIAALTAAGADVHAVDSANAPSPSRCKSRSAPIHIAAFWGHADAVRALLAAGADPNDSAVGGDGVASAWAARRRSAAAAWALEVREARKELARIQNGGFFPSNEDLGSDDDDDDDDEKEEDDNEGEQFSAEEMFAPEEAPSKPRWSAEERKLWRSRRALHNCWTLNALKEKAVASLDDADCINNFLFDATTTPLLAAIAGADAAREPSVRESEDGDAEIDRPSKTSGRHLDVIKALLAAGANPSAPFRDSEAEAPLMAAVRLEQNEIAGLLIAAGALVDAPLSTCVFCEQQHSWMNGKSIQMRVGGVVESATTVLHVAARLGNPATVRLLVSAGADPNVRNSLGVTPLHEAVRFASSGINPKCFDAVVRELIDSGATASAVDAQGITPLTLLNYCDSPFWGNRSEAKICVRLASAVRLLMAAGAHPLALGGEVASSRDYEDTEGAVVFEDDAKSLPPLVIACRYGVQCTIRSMLERVVIAPPSLLLHMSWSNPNLFSCCSAQCDASALVRLIAAAGGDVNRKNSLGWSVLHKVLRTQNFSKNHLEIVRTLLNLGADARSTGPDGTTPLMLAAKRRNKELVELILASGADVRAATKNALTAIRCMFRSGQIVYDSHRVYEPVAPIVQLLVDAGAVRDPSGGVDVVCLAETIATVVAHIEELKALAGNNAALPFVWHNSLNPPDVVFSDVEDARRILEGISAHT